MSGKNIRLSRIMDLKTKKTVIVPMDHGVSMGPVEGLVDMNRAVGQAAAGNADAVVIHKGLVLKNPQMMDPNLGLIVHLSASTSLSTCPLAKTLVCTVEEAIKAGADAVSIHVNLGNESEKQMLSDLGQVGRQAQIWGMPLLAMIYVRGPEITDEYDPGLIKHAARIGAELGADLVKVPYTGSPETFADVINGCPVPVVIAGGPKMDTDRDVLEMVQGAISAGAAGLSIGRNVFQHESPAAMVSAMRMIVHEGQGVNQALAILSRVSRKAA